jgi:hypothetical protein
MKAPSRLTSEGLRALRLLPEVQASPLLRFTALHQRSFHNSRIALEDKKEVDRSSTPSFAQTLQGSTYTRLQRERENEARYVRARLLKASVGGGGGAFNSLGLGLGESTDNLTA